MLDFASAITSYTYQFLLQAYFHYLKQLFKYRPILSRVFPHRPAVFAILSISFLTLYHLIGAL